MNKIALIFLLFYATNAFSLEDIYENKNGISWGEYFNLFNNKGYNKSYALVVGVSQFNDFRDLPTTQDAIKIRDHLVKKASFDYVYLLTGSDATINKIRDLMVDFFPNKIKNNDRFLFYWSGHGVTRNKNNNIIGYLPVEKSTHENYSEMISMDEVSRWDDLLEAKQTLYIIDSCFSGLAGISTKGGIKNIVLDEFARPSRQILSAGLAGEQTIATDRIGGSLFTNVLLRGLNGGADTASEFGKDGIVSITELKQYVTRKINEDRKKLKWKKRITPQLRSLSSSSEGDFFFVLSRNIDTQNTSRNSRPSEEVKALQKLLSEKGIYKGNFDGLRSSDYNIALDRYIGSDKEKVDVYLLQRKLKNLGFYKGKIDGVVSFEVREALQKFMSSRR